MINIAKNTKWLSIFYDYAYICKPSLEKLPKDLNKIYQLFAGLISIIEKNVISVIPRNILFVGFRVTKFKCYKLMTLSKNLPRKVV